MVAEDFSPFNINVTTVEPATITNGKAIRAAIGGDSTWLGGGAGGVAYIDSFTNSLSNTIYVFPKELANGYWRYVGEATSHEAGHSLGLYHQGRFSSTGALVEEYNSGTSARAPIMGNSYSTTRGTWWSGTDSEGYYQDDLAVLSRVQNGFGYRADDHGDWVASATALVIEENQASGSGIITTASDVDYFSFTTGSGEVSFTVSVPAGINNLDARLELRDSAGALITSVAPTTSFGATITTALAAGSYRLVVGSQGNYGDIGQYTVSGTIVPVEIVTVNPPTNLAVTRAADGVALSWTDNETQETSILVERRTAGGSWAVIKTLAPNTSAYTDTTAEYGASYEYRVVSVRDAVLSNPSNMAALTIAPAAPSGLTAAVASSTRVNLTWGNVTGETGFKVERLINGVVNAQWQTVADVTSFSDTTAAAGSTYQYRVRAINTGGESANSTTVSVTTPNTLTLPTAPSSMVAVVNANRQVQLSWKDNSTNETLFVVQRSTNNSSWTTLGQVPANATGAIDGSAVRGRTYYYRVFAYNSLGYSAASNSARVSYPYYSRAASTQAVGTTAAIQSLPGGMVTPPNRKATTPTIVAKAQATSPKPAVTSNGSATSHASEVDSLRASTTTKLAASSSTSSEWQDAVDTLFGKLGAF